MVQLLEDCDLRKDFRIFIDPASEEKDWPPKYNKEFKTVREIKKVQWQDYANDAEKSRVFRDRIMHLKEVANECKRDCVNELTWRLRTEPLVFKRFDEPFTCCVEACGKPLWQSYYQNPSEYPLDHERLQKSRCDRTLCHCAHENMPKDLKRTYVNELFSYQAGGPVTHSEHDDIPTERVKGRHARQPDRIMGLKQQGSLQTLLSKKPERRARHKAWAGKQKKGPCILYYPFLVLEAKSEKSEDAFSTIEKQTAIPIRVLLKLQFDLFVEAYPAAKYASGPLIWFFGNRGEDWHLYGCVTDTRDILPTEFRDYYEARSETSAPKFAEKLAERVKYVSHKVPSVEAELTSKQRILRLWEGKIDKHDEALQLLLLTDYVCEWARDTYEPRIRRWLEWSQENGQEDGGQKDSRARPSPPANNESTSPARSYSTIPEMHGTSHHNKPPLRTLTPTSQFPYLENEFEASHTDDDARRRSITDSSMDSEAVTETVIAHVSLDDLIRGASENNSGCEEDVKEDVKEEAKDDVEEDEGNDTEDKGDDTEDEGDDTEDEGDDTEDEGGDTEDEGDDTEDDAQGDGEDVENHSGDGLSQDVYQNREASNEAIFTEAEGLPRSNLDDETRSPGPLAFTTVGEDAAKEIFQAKEDPRNADPGLQGVDVVEEREPRERASSDDQSRSPVNESFTTGVESFKAEISHDESQSRPQSSAADLPGFPQQTDSNPNKPVESATSAIRISARYPRTRVDKFSTSSPELHKKMTKRAFVIENKCPGNTAASQPLFGTFTMKANSVFGSNSSQATKPYGYHKDKPWNEYAEKQKSVPAIRPAWIVKFTFFRLHIPDKGLEDIIESVSRYGKCSSQRAMKYILQNMLSNPLWLLEEEIEELERLWTQPSSRQSTFNKFRDAVCQFWYYTYFTNDWELVRELVCISVSSRNVLAKLQEFSRMENEAVPAVPSSKTFVENLRQAVTELRGISSPEALVSSAVALRWDLNALHPKASSSFCSDSTAKEKEPLRFGLSHDQQRIHRSSVLDCLCAEQLSKNWADIFPGEKLLPRPAPTDVEKEKLSWLSHSTLSLEYPPSISTVSPARFPTLPESVVINGLLILKRRYRSFGTGLSRYCIVLLKSRWTDHTLAQSIESALIHGQVYLARVDCEDWWLSGSAASNYITQDYRPDEDQSVLRSWINELEPGEGSNTRSNTPSSASEDLLPTMSSWTNGQIKDWMDVKLPDEQQDPTYTVAASHLPDLLRFTSTSR